MKKIFKRLTLLCAAFCITFSSVLIAACDNETENTDPTPPPSDDIVIDYGKPELDGYVITLVYPDGKPVKGTDAPNTNVNARVGVRLLDEDGEVIDGTTAKINVSGTAVINHKLPGKYKVEVLNCPSGYAPNEETFITSEDKAWHTFKLDYASPAPYSVTVTLPDGSPAVNKRVRFYEGSTMVTEVRTDDKGEAVTPAIDRRSYDVVVVIGDNDNYIQKSVKSNVAADPVSISLEEYYKLAFDDAHKLDEETVKSWDEKLNNSLVTRFDITGNNYAYTANVSAGKEVFFSFTAPKTGSYTIGSKGVNDPNDPKKDISDYEIKFYANDISYFDSGLTIDSKTNSGNNIQQMRVEKGEKLTFSVTTSSGNAGIIDFLICQPVPAPISTNAVDPGDYTVTFEDYHTAILNFKPTKSGVYTVTSDTDLDVQLVTYANGRPIPLVDGATNDLTGDFEGLVGDDNSKDGRNFKYNEVVKNSYVGNTYSYHIMIKDANISYPAQVKIKIERTADAPDEIQVIHKTATTDVSKKYEDQQGAFTWMPADGSIETVEENGLWYAVVDGVKKPLVAAITKKLMGLADGRPIELEYSFSTVELFGDDGGNIGGGDSDGRKNTNLTVYEDLTKRDIDWNYTEFIAKYAKLVNSDGVYEVNAELKLFLERYLNQRYTDITSDTAKPNQPWLLGCGYYA